jgi:hypothetical protein
LFLPFLGFFSVEEIKKREERKNLQNVVAGRTEDQTRERWSGESSKSRESKEDESREDKRAKRK